MIKATITPKRMGEVGISLILTNNAYTLNKYNNKQYNESASSKKDEEKRICKLIFNVV